MGQCGCGETVPENGFKLPSGLVVAYDVYRGCRDCFSGPAVCIYVYPNAKSEWLQHAKIEPYKPDEYGGNHGHGIPVSLFEVEDLINAAKAIGELKTSRDGYLTFADWLEDNGLRMMQDAMRLFTARMERLAKER